MKRYRFWRGLAAALSVLLAMALSFTAVADVWEGSISMFLNVETGSTTGEAETRYESRYGELNADNLEKLKADIDDFITEEMEEGAVLLSNNGVLPLPETGLRISLFGTAAYDTVYKDHSAGADPDPKRLVSLKDAFENIGYSVNETLYNAYANGPAKRSSADNGQATIGEQPVSFYTSDIVSSFSDYQDAAIVVFARIGGEGFDLNLSDSDGVPQLALHDSEKELLDFIAANGFDRIIVLINAGFTMEVHELAEHDVDACMWIGLPGLTGCQGVANLISGKVSPSGRTVDTYAINSLSAPAIRNFGDFQFVNQSDLSYVINAESIYVGYKYYETRYEDTVLGTGNAASAVGSSTGEAWNYTDEVLYPFGYGLSYTSFSQELISCDYDEAADTFTLLVKVENTGDKAGKDVVEVYLQSPYSDYDRENLVEKASIQLVGFNKSKELAPGESEEITVTVDRYLCASYDGNNAKGYILSPGDYYLAIGSDAHDALNNVLAAKGYTTVDGMTSEGDAAKTAKWTVDNLDVTSYRNSASTGEEVTNVFSGEYAIDINDFYDAPVVTYLTRQDWEGTWPRTYSGLEASQALLDATNSYTYVKSPDAKSLSDVTMGVNFQYATESRPYTTPITLYDTFDWEYDDPRWADFIDQLPLEYLVLAIDNNTGLKALPEIGKPVTRDADGPNGYTFNYNLNGKSLSKASLYGCQMLAGSSWNPEILKKFGDFYAEECLYTRGNEVFGPGLNLHRTPYSGRNFEYFSEDSIFTYLAGAIESEAMQAKGLISAPKHFCANDQEKNRSGLCTFMTEQRIRQECMKGFEGSVTKAKAGGLMGMMGRIGAHADMVCRPLLMQVLRGEWGFTGSIITDAGGQENSYQPTVDCIAAGTDQFCLISRSSVMLKAIQDTDDGDLAEILKEVNHRYYYTRSHSNLANQIGKSVVISNQVPWWKVALYVIDSVLFAGFAAAVALYCVSAYRKKKKA